MKCVGQHCHSRLRRRVDFMRLILLLLATATTTVTADPVAAADDDGYQLTVAMPPIVLNIIAMDEDIDMAEFNTQLSLAMETHLDATLPETLAPSNIMSAADFRHVSLTGDIQRVELGKQEEGQPSVVPTFTQIDAQQVIPEETPLSLIQANLRGYAEFSFASLKAQELASDRTTQVATSIELATMESLEGPEYDQLLELMGEVPALALAIKLQISVAGEVLNEGNVPNDGEQEQLEGDSDSDKSKKGGIMRIVSSVGILVMMIMMLATLYKCVKNKREEHLKKQRQGKKNWKRPKSEHSESSQSQSQRSLSHSDQEAWMDAKAQQLATVQTRPVGSPARKSKRMLRIQQQQQGPGGLYAITEEDSMNCSSNFDGSFRREGSYRNQETFINEFGNKEESYPNDKGYRVDGEYDYDDPSGLLQQHQNYLFRDDDAGGIYQNDSFHSNSSNSFRHAGGRDEQSSPSGRLINFYRYNNEFCSPVSNSSHRSLGSYRYNESEDYASPAVGSNLHRSGASYRYSGADDYTSPAGQSQQSYPCNENSKHAPAAGGHSHLSGRSYRYPGGREDPRHNSMLSSTSSFISNGSESQSSDSYRFGSSLRRIASLAANNESFTRQATSQNGSIDGSTNGSLNGSYRYNGTETSRRESGSFNNSTNRSSLSRFGGPFQAICKADPFHINKSINKGSTLDNKQSHLIPPEQPRKQVHFRAYDSYRENSNRGGYDDSYSSRMSTSLRQEDVVASVRSSPTKPRRQYYDDELPTEDESIQLFGDLPSDKELEYAAAYEMELEGTEEEEELSMDFEDIDLSGKRSFELTPVNSSIV